MLRRLRRVRIGRVEELLLCVLVGCGAFYPILRELASRFAPVLCGLPTNGNVALVEEALRGKIACAVGLAVLLPVLTRVLAGSWRALAGIRVPRAILSVAGVATTTLTAYDACTGFHATQRTAEGCACWLTAAVAGAIALAVALLILSGRALLALFRDAVVAIIAAIFGRTAATHAPFAVLCEALAAARGALLARHRAPRGPPSAFELALTPV